MPIPHEVTKEFFIPSDDLPFLDDDVTQNINTPIEQRLNDFMFLINLLDAAFGQRNNDEASPTNTNTNTNTNDENSEDEEENEHQEETSMHEDKIETPDEESSETTPEDVEDPVENSEEEPPQSTIPPPSTERSRFNMHSLNDLDILTLELLLMRHRMRNQQRDFQRQMTENIH